MKKPGVWSLLADSLIVVAVLAVLVIPAVFNLNTGMSLTNMLAPPGGEFWLGTDNMGRDLLVRISQVMFDAVFPIWSGVLVGTLIGGVSAVLCLSWAKIGLINWVSSVLQSVSILVAGIPIGIAVFAWAAVREEADLLPVMVSLASLFGARSFLLILDLFAHDSKLGYWEAARSFGSSPFRLVFQYGVLGSWRDKLLSALGFHLRVAVAIEASLSYLGFGIQEPGASFGNMLASHFELYLRGQSYILIVIVMGLSIVALFPASLINLIRQTIDLTGRKVHISNSTKSLGLSAANTRSIP